MRCPPLLDPDGGVVDIQGEGAPGDTATYSCDIGRALTGQRTRVCGTDGEWEGEAPTCECKWYICSYNVVIGAAEYIYIVLLFHQY